MPKKIIIAEGRKDIDRVIREMAKNATVQMKLAGVKDRIGDMDVTSYYKDLDPQIVKKINYCTDQGEPFGLSCEDSVVIIAPAINTALWYGKDLNVTINEFGDRPKLAMFVHSLLLTHQDFMSPLTVGEFITRAKKYIDERKQPKPLLPDAPLSEPTEPTGSVETGE